MAAASGGSSRARLEEFIQRAYDDTARFIEKHPYSSIDRDAGDNAVEP